MQYTSALFAITPTTASVTAGGALPLTTVARRISPRINLGSDSVNIACPGYYSIHATITFTAATAGNVIISATQNGEAIPGITASTTITTANTQIATLSLEGIVRVRCEPIAISLVNDSAVDINTTNISLSVEKIY